MGRLTSLPSAVITDDSALGGAVIEKSLRFNDNDSAYLSRTPSTDGNRKTYTISAWVRRSTNGSTHPIFSRYTANNDSGFLGLYLNSDDYIYFTGWSTVYVKSNRLYRDTNSWAHIVLAVDTTQGNASDRIKLYFNGELQTLATYNAPSQNADLRINEASAEHMIGRYSSAYFDGYMAEVNFVDGFQLTPSSFGYTEFQTGIWRPKGYFGSYGTNGFRLDFSDNSATTAVTLGKDRSGQGNDFTPNNFSVSAGVNNDSFLESPTAKKEFPTFNSNLQTSSSTEYRQGNLAFYTSGSSAVQTRANMSRSSGKWYAEFTLTTYTSRSGSFPYIGVAPDGNFTNIWAGNNGTAYNSYGHIYRNSSQLETGHATYAQGDVISVAINLDSSPPQVWWAKNGTYIRSGNPATGAYGINIEPASASGTYTFSMSLYANPGQWDANFGQRAFAHSIPEGFKTLNTDNFSINTPSIIRPQRHFKTIVYTPNSGALTVTGLEFQPDFLWFKSRNQAYHHYVFDSIRGTGAKSLRPSDTTPEPASGDATEINAFLPNGFSMAGSSGINDNGSGANGAVAWCWKAGGTAVTNNDGNNTSQVSANTEAGFSILTYTGNGTNNSNITMGHGLGKTPAWVIIKNRSSSSEWVTWVRGIGGSADNNQKNLSLNTTNTAGQNSDQFRYADATTIQVRSTDSTNGKVNKNGNNYVAYCWAEIPGYSKFGVYLGNASTDGPYVELGFRPALVITKSYNGISENWTINDSTRSSSNPVDLFLRADENTTETSSAARMDFLAKGFKLRTSDTKTNRNNTGYVYMAFAEQPGESAYHTDTNAR